uniref:Capsid protein n=1 Tax=Motacilla cinerea CRESS-DNA-virus sp. TaxID=2815043 RepID=A0A8A4XD30_9VIRU|nr:MAG: capsid protein [Motacilla cinerea CRESS-DNA-virus sp.]
MTRTHHHRILGRKSKHPFPFKNPGPKRQGRPRAHFSFVHKEHMQVTQSQAGEDASRTNKHEAQMIPGLSRRVWGFPNSIITKLRYCDIISHTSTLGAIGNNSFAANGIFDPDISGVGHQPMFRDVYAGVYDQYVVIGAKITATFSPKTASMVFVCGVTGDDDSSGSSNAITRMEQNNSQFKLTGTADGCSPVTIVSTFEPLEAFGVDAKADGSSATAVGSNPSELWVWQCWVATADGASTGTVLVAYEIEYTVKFSELQTQTQN